MNVAVLMSTYNGEKYIKEQIESILGQENVSVEIFIRDDGSIDHTVDIVEKYDNINIIRGENIGVGNSFMELVYKVPNSFEFYAFADQDDIWLNNKMEKGIEKIRHQKGPMVCQFHLMQFTTLEIISRKICLILWIFYSRN